VLGPGARRTKEAVGVDAVDVDAVDVDAVDGEALDAGVVLAAFPLAVARSAAAPQPASPGASARVTIRAETQVRVGMEPPGAAAWIMSKRRRTR